jgi:predicted RNA-binding Zn ribbon-like protein
VTAQASIPGERDHPSLALVNSRHNSRTGPVDHLATPEELGEWLAWRSLVERGAGDAERGPRGATPGDAELGARGATPGDAFRGPRGAIPGDAGRGPRGTTPGDAELAAVHALRDAVRELLVAAIEGRSPSREALAAVNEASVAAPRSEQLRWDQDGPHRTRVAPAGSAIQRALAALAADAIELVCERRDDLIACEAPGCVRLLLKDHPRRHWCSTRCGDRVRAARHYRRSREAAR